MTSKLISAAVLAAAALTSFAASADSFNPYLWDQMKAPSTRTRAEVKAELTQTRQAATPVAATSAYYGALAQTTLNAPVAGKAADAPQAAAQLRTTSQQ